MTENNTANGFTNDFRSAQPQHVSAACASPTEEHLVFAPALSTADWNAEWQQMQNARNRPDNSAEWDARALNFPADAQTGPYARRFIDLMGIRPGETVFDMGCGTGSIALPLGELGHKVVAADFSQGMLDRMQAVMESQGIRTVFPKLMSWDEDWAAKGVRTGMVDICVASRSIATHDLRDSLLRLTDIARRRVCITLPTGSSPRTDERILSELGLSDAVFRQHLYAICILANEGLFPRVDYIQSQRYETFASHEEAAESLQRMIDNAAGAVTTEAQRQSAYARLHAWLNDNLVANDQVGSLDKHGLPQKALCLRNPRIITWAFISWDK